MVLSLVRWIPIWVPATIPKRYSSPTCAPESSPNRSDARLRNVPAPSGRVNRCVTRNELPNRGTRSVVGSATRVKSGCAGLTARSLIAGRGASCACAAGAAAVTVTAVKHAAAKISSINGLGCWKRPSAPIWQAGCRREFGRNPSKMRRPAAPSYRRRNCLPPLKGLFDPVLGEVVAERALADPHRLRRVLLDASRGFQRAADGLALDPVQVLPEVQRRDA